MPLLAPLLSHPSPPPALVPLLTVLLPWSSRRSGLSLQQFQEEYEAPNRPVVITDALAHWPAQKKWNREYLLEAFASRKSKVIVGECWGEGRRGQYVCVCVLGQQGGCGLYPYESILGGDPGGGGCRVGWGGVDWVRMSPSGGGGGGGGWAVSSNLASHLCLCAGNYDMELSAYLQYCDNQVGGGAASTGYIRCSAWLG